jgi:hypothetical protein
MNKSDQLATLSSLAKRLESLIPRNDDEIALVGFLVGAIHSLREATQISDKGYSDEHLDPTYSKILMKEINTLAKGNDVSDSIWLAGYFFNSGLYRISALNERIDKYLGTQADLATDVRREINRFKHDVEGVLGGRKVTMDDALAGLEKLVQSLETFMKK